MLDSLDTNTKIRLKTFSLFTALLLVMTLILSGFIFLSKNKWNTRLADNVKEVLIASRGRDFAGKLKVGDSVHIDSAIAVSSNVYEILNKKSQVEGYALITRITTYYGPQAAVFLYTENDGITFEGFACLNSRVSKQFANSDSDIILKYWAKNAEKIFQSAGVIKGAENE